MRSRVKKASHAKGTDKIKEGVYYGQIELRQATSRKKMSKRVALEIRDRSSKKVIARTTADESGNFHFANMKIQKGMELGWSVPQEVGEPVGEDGCYQLLPYDYTTLEPIEECDDSVMQLRAGISNCTVSPCPWEKKLKEHGRPEQTN